MSRGLTKEQIRTEIRRKIKTVDRIAESFAICCRIQEVLPQTGHVIAYEPLDDEPDITPILRELRAEDRLVLIEGDHAAPSLSHDAVIALALVPGRAFDKKGNRIGRGGGTFDRILADLDCPKFGIAFDCQIVDDIPADSHDIRMDGILSASKAF